MKDNALIEFVNFGGALTFSLCFGFD